MAMFEERPYRQKKKSLWSVWWFVGLMASGLTAWHLELIPFGDQQTVGILLEDEDFVQQNGLLNQPIVKSTKDSAAMPHSELPPSQREEAFGQLSPPEPPGVESQAEPAFGVSVASYASKQNPVIQQASYEQTIPEQNHSVAPPQPFFESKEEFVPVRTLTYRPETEPVNAAHIPTAKSPLPIQYANHQQVQNRNVNKISNPASQQTAALQNLEKPFQLSPEAEQVIQRHRELSSQYWHDPQQRTEMAVEL